MGTITDIYCICVCPFRPLIDAEGKEDTVFGPKIFNIVASCQDYNLHFPIRRGRLNVHNGVGGSPTAVLADMAAIWTHAIVTGLGVPLTTLEKYRAVLVIPALYDRPVIKHLVSLLLNDLGFGGCFVVQECITQTGPLSVALSLAMEIHVLSCSRTYNKHIHSL